MIKIEAIVREDKFEEVKEALDKVGVNGITVSQVMGCGKQKGYVEFVRGSEVDITLHPKIKFEIVVSSEEWEQKTIKAILEAAYSGKPGDGKIFSYDMRSVTRIRTKETGTAAIN
ncbi:MAG: P-II family nitrogen regulator [Endomicrobium sp.]|jgi:nitrogen regulatory protein P-II 1|nr:P-II family nitrogen regulator [Endomicrobium sp.]